MKKPPYRERRLIERVRVNLYKARKLFGLREWSASILRSFSAVEVFVTGLIQDRLEKKVGSPFSKNLPRKLRLEEKLTWCFESLYGFSMSQKYRTTFSRVQALAKKRNEIAHEGVLSNKKQATEAYETATRVITKLAGRLRINTKRLEQLLSTKLAD